MCEPFLPLYRNAIPSSRSGPLFNAFPYPTKISPEAVALFIASHTEPGATVLDGFAGSGTTGLAALLCARPTETLIAHSKKLNLPVQWGPRRAILYELSSLGAFVAHTLCAPPDPKEFFLAATQLLETVEAAYSWLYQATDPTGESGCIRYVVWSDILICPQCQHQATLWETCVTRQPAQIASNYRCPGCQRMVAVDKAQRLVETVCDDLLSSERNTRARLPVWIYGATGKYNWSRRVTAADAALIHRVGETDLPAEVPIMTIPWGDLYRSGYHEGISHLHHFYTRRNLIAFAQLWSAVSDYPQHLQDALRFWLLSYNAAHATIMTRVVAKQLEDDLVVTSAQPGVLYVSGLPVEKNIFAGVRRKLETITRAFAATCHLSNLVAVHNASSLSLDLADDSIDYVFTDPPFGGNIPYAEVNFINEAWLGRTTQIADEAIMSPSQGKTLHDYQHLLTTAFQEVHRVLKPAAKATVVFHSSSAQVWNALRRASEDAGLRLVDTSVLDKTQGSFKQVTAKGAVRGDPIMLFEKGKQLPSKSSDIAVLFEQLLRDASASDDPGEKTPQRLYSRFITRCLENQHDVPVDAAEFYREMERRNIAP